MLVNSKKPGNFKKPHGTAALNARKVAEYLKKHPAVDKVHYLGFLKDSDPQKAIFEKQCYRQGP
jgi:cystathionine beta-lyase/cystathionine gamma-synthase